jgi:hypothetical protein
MAAIEVAYRYFEIGQIKGFKSRTGRLLGRATCGRPEK